MIALLLVVICLACYIDVSQKMLDYARLKEKVDALPCPKCRGFGYIEGKGICNCPLGPYVDKRMLESKTGKNKN